jgi:hypothetical protein
VQLLAAVASLLVVHLFGGDHSLDDARTRRFRRRAALLALASLCFLAGADLR